MPLSVSNWVASVPPNAARTAVRGRTDVDVERARAVAVEFDVDLRRELLGRAGDVGRARRVLQRGQDLLRVGIGLAARRRHGEVDRLRVAAARSGRGNRDHLARRARARRPMPGHRLARCRRSNACGWRSRKTCSWPFEPRFSAAAEALLRRSGGRGDALDVGSSRNRSVRAAHRRVGRRQRRAGRELHLRRRSGRDRPAGMNSKPTTPSGISAIAATVSTSDVRRRRFSGAASADAQRCARCTSCAGVRSRPRTRR